MTKGKIFKIGNGSGWCYVLQYTQMYIEVRAHFDTLEEARACAKRHNITVVSEEI